MPPGRILIVDDDPAVRQTLARILEREGYVVGAAGNGAQALSLLRQQNYDLLIVDLNMQPVDGLQVLQAARERDPDIVVIILTGYGSLDSAIQALRNGAFDYLLKPARPDTLRQRVAAGWQQRQQALQRRQLLEQIAALKAMLESLPSPDTAFDARRFLQSGPLTIDRYHRVATLNGRPLDLTTAEFDILACLVEASPQPLPPTDIVRCALGYTASPLEAREIVKWHIHRLRRKIEATPTRPQHIKTVRHQGYLWTP